MDGFNKSLYQCCFCNILIESTNVEPCEINTLTNFDKPKNQQYHQAFYCHLKCFEKQLHEKVRFYLALECLLPEKSNSLENNE